MKELQTEFIQSTNPLRVYYEGELQDKTAFAIFDALETVAFKNETGGLKRKLLVTCIELLQNVQNYYRKKNWTDSKIKLCVTLEESTVLIAVENELSVNDRPELEKNLNEICRLNETELKESIKRKLHDPVRAAHSAGIGLLEVLQFSNRNVDFSFAEKTKEKFLFRIEAKINTKQ